MCGHNLRIPFCEKTSQRLICLVFSSNSDWFLMFLNIIIQDINKKALTLFSLFLQCQIPDSCISPTNLVVRSGRRNRVPFPRRTLQHLHSTPAWQALQATRTLGLQLGARPWLGHKACKVSAHIIRWSTRRIAMLLGQSRNLGKLPCGKFLRWGSRHFDEDQIFSNTDWLHTHERRGVCGLCTDMPWQFRKRG